MNVYDSSLKHTTNLLIFRYKTNEKISIDHLSQEGGQVYRKIILVEGTGVVVVPMNE